MVPYTDTALPLTHTDTPRQQYTIEDSRIGKDSTTTMAGESKMLSVCRWHDQKETGQARQRLTLAFGGALALMAGRHAQARTDARVYTISLLSPSQRPL